MWNTAGSPSLIPMATVTSIPGSLKAPVMAGPFSPITTEMPLPIISISLNKRVDYEIPPDPSSTIYYGYHANGIKNSITIGTWETHYGFDDLEKNITSVTDPRGKTTYLSYDDDDNLDTLTDPMGRTTVFTYNSNSNLTSVTTPVSTIFFTYFTNGNLQTFTDPNGFVTIYTYDSFGYLAQVDYPEGSPASFFNDSRGLPSSSTQKRHYIGLYLWRPGPVDPDKLSRWKIHKLCIWF